MEEQYMSNFIQDCLEGKALYFDIDDYISKWHNSNSDAPLYKYLGMSKAEYALYVEDDEYIPLIVAAHKDNIPVRSIVESKFSIAARFDDSSKAKRLKNWLKSENLWEE